MLLSRVFPIKQIVHLSIILSF